MSSEASQTEMSWHNRQQSPDEMSHQWVKIPDSTTQVSSSASPPSNWNVASLRPLLSLSNSPNFMAYFFSPLKNCLWQRLDESCQGGGRRWSTGQRKQVMACSLYLSGQTSIISTPPPTPSLLLSLPHSCYEITQQHKLLLGAQACVISWSENVKAGLEHKPSLWCSMRTTNNNII